MDAYYTSEVAEQGLQYQIAWVTQYRFPALYGEMATRAREIICSACLNREVQILRGHVGVDHVQLLVGCPPSLSPADLVAYLKDTSSYVLQEEFPHLKTRYWGEPMWNSDYFCATIGNSTTNEIHNYIETHPLGMVYDHFTVHQPSFHGIAQELEPTGLFAEPLTSPE